MLENFTETILSVESKDVSINHKPNVFREMRLVKVFELSFLDKR